MPRKVKDLTGQRFGSKVVLHEDVNHSDSRIRWIVKCDCGEFSSQPTYPLRITEKCRYCAHKGDRPNRRLRPYEATYNIFMGRAKYPVSITYTDFIELTKQTSCHYCGDIIFWKEYRTPENKGGTGSNLDRKDNTLGYSKDNVAVCCGRCNYAKGSHFTYDEWVKIGELIRTWGYNTIYKITPQSKGLK